MADRSHFFDTLAQGGVEAWNSWRALNLGIVPDLSEAILTRADLSRADLSRADLSRANLSRADLTGANLREANLSAANLSAANLSRAYLSAANLSRAYLSRAYLSGAYLSEAILTRANLFQANLREAILSRADLSRANLYEADLREANLTGANLTGADLSKANLSGADLSRADLSKANLSGADLREANLSRADLSHADLRRSALVKTDLARATLTGCRIYGISAWSLNLEGAKQWNLNVSDEDEPAVIVDDLEVAQFVYLLLNHRKLRNVLDAITERGVLILGRFGGGGLEVLEAVAAKLREAEYQPFIFDFDRPADRNYTETVKTLVGLSRFVIVDLSGPSVPQELYATVPHFKIPFVPIIEEGRGHYSMAVDILEYPWVVNPPVRFAGIDDLVGSMPTRIIAPAEEWVKDRKARLADLADR